MQQGLQRWAGIIDAAIIEIALGHPLLGLDDVLHAVDEHLQILRLGLENVGAEHGRRVVENLAQETMHEMFGDTIAQPTGQHLPAIVLEVLQRFQIAMLDQESGLPVLDAQARPDFRNQQTDIVIHAHVWADKACGTGKPRIAGKNKGNQCVVQISRRPQRVEWPLGQCPFTAGARRGGRLPGQ